MNATFFLKCEHPNCCCRHFAGEVLLTVVNVPVVCVWLYWIVLQCTGVSMVIKCILSLKEREKKTIIKGSSGRGFLLSA